MKSLRGLLYRHKHRYKLTEIIAVMHFFVRTGRNGVETVWFRG